MLNSNIEKIKYPQEIIKKYELNDKDKIFIKNSKETISNIINWLDNRLLIITWPCSIHNIDGAIEYWKKLNEIIKTQKNVFIVMRAYFEKPRTNLWWKWFINDPDLDGSYNIEKWLELSRKILIELTKLEIPLATEFLDIMTYNYIYDLISWWAIWARTTESQEHRKIVSWFDMTVWFKNWTSWDIQIAIDAIKTASQWHTFIWTNLKWELCKIKTKWNKNWHIILRWWNWWPNYDEKNIKEVIEKLEKNNIQNWIIIDFSHWNSQKNHKNQIKVREDISNQIKKWNKKIVWVMIESNINEWNQNFNIWIDNKNNLKYWVSITDACLNIKDTIEIIQMLEKAKN